MADTQITKECESCGAPFIRKCRLGRFKRQRFCSKRCSARATAKTRRITNPAARFWAKVNKDGPIPEHRPDIGPCWLWTAGLDGHDYGGFNLGRDGGRRIVRAHRWAYEATVGPIPEGLTIDHLCRTHPCVNPLHLEPVTRGENVLRGECISAQRARQTHCVYGHPFDETNTIKTKWGRECQTCRHEKAVQRWQNILAARRA